MWERGERRRSGESQAVRREGRCIGQGQGGGAEGNQGLDGTATQEVREGTQGGIEIGDVGHKR